MGDGRRRGARNQARRSPRRKKSLRMMSKPRSKNPSPTAYSWEESGNHPADNSAGNSAILIVLVDEVRSRPVDEYDCFDYVANLKEKCGDLQRLPSVWKGWLGCLAAVRKRSLSQSFNLRKCRLC